MVLMMGAVTLLHLVTLIMVTLAFNNIIGSVAAQKISPAGLLDLRAQMGKYGIRPADVAYIVNNDEYYNLIDASGFTDITEVGSDVATKLTGVVGSVFGSPVIVTDQLAARPSGDGTTTAAAAVYTPNYVIPRLRGVNIETDYEVAEQRTAIVASQSLGFNELVAAAVGNKPCGSSTLHLIVILTILTSGWFASPSFY